MNEQLIPLIVIAPLLTALLTPLLSYFSSILLRIFSVLSVAVSAYSALQALLATLENGPLRYFFGGWPPPIGIEYVIDPLSGIIALLISSISLIVIVYAGSYLKNENWLKQATFFGLYLLITAGLLGMVVTGDVFNLYVFLEISSLATYGIIAAGGYKGMVASFKYLLLGTIGASLYLLGIGYLYGLTGTLNMLDLQILVQPLMDTPALMIALVLIAVGLALKTALFPLHGWLPDAYTYAPPPATAFISGVATKVPAYVMLRLFYMIFAGAEGLVPQIMTVLGWLAVGGIIIGSIMAIAQTDLRRMLAYSSVAQVGYIVLGLAIGNIYAFIGAVLHIISHAVMKSCLFLVAGGVQYKNKDVSIEGLIGMCKKMPLSMGALVLAALSMIGIPPMGGFFSKWYLVLGAIEKNMWIYVAVLVLSSLLNLIYFFRLIENIYLRNDKETNVTTAPKGLELPLPMIIPILVLGIGIVAIGLCNEQIVTQVLQFAVMGGGY